MSLTENNAHINSVGDVVNSVFGTSFDFGGVVGDDGKTA